MKPSYATAYVGDILIKVILFTACTENPAVTRVNGKAQSSYGAIQHNSAEKWKKKLSTKLK